MFLCRILTILQPRRTCLSSESGLPCLNALPPSPSLPKPLRSRTTPLCPKLQARCFALWNFPFATYKDARPYWLQHCNISSKQHKRTPGWQMLFSFFFSFSNMPNKVWECKLEKNMKKNLHIWCRGTYEVWEHRCSNDRKNHLDIKINLITIFFMYDATKKKTSVIASVACLCLGDSSFP